MGSQRLEFLLELPAPVINGWTLPGHSFECGRDGEPMLSLCDNGHWKRVSQSCNQAGCRTGYEGWASKEGARIEEVLAKMKEEIYPTKQVVHVVLAPAERHFQLPFKELRDVIRKAARKAGCWAGALIFHPFRERCRRCGLRKADDDEKYGDACSCSNGIFDWVWSPHFHFIGFAWIVNSNVIAREKGIVVRNMGTRKTVKGTVQYLLSHCGVWNEGKTKAEAVGMFPSSETSKHSFQSITWLRPLRVKFKFPKRSKEVKCEQCGAPTHRMKLTKELDMLIGPGQRGELTLEETESVLMNRPYPEGVDREEAKARRKLEIEWRRAGI